MRDNHNRVRAVVIELVLGDRQASWRIELES